VQELAALPAVAREAIRAHLEGRTPCPPVEATGALARAAPVFVTLRIDGHLRGCMGTLIARFPDLVGETMDRALVTAFEDPRFPPLRPDELPRCTIEVTVLGPLEEVAGEAELDPQHFGVEVTDEFGRCGVLLPAIDGIVDAKTQVGVARRKAGIPEGAPVRLRRFTVTKVEEPAEGAR